MYAVTSSPLDRRTRATFRSAEFGFFGVTVFTCVQTPRFWGDPFLRRVRFWSYTFSVYWSAGALLLLFLALRPLRTNWLMVGIKKLQMTKQPAYRRAKGRTQQNARMPLALWRAFPPCRMLSPTPYSIRRTIA